MVIAISSPSPVTVGPTGWPNENRTLFWEIAPYWARYLKQADGDNAGQPWMFTPEQARFVAWWYAIDDTGRFAYRRGTLRRMKGWGKDPLGAVLSATELLFPCRFAGWRADGSPVAAVHPAPWVQIAAVSRDQTRNTMRVFPGLFNDAAIERWSIEVNKEIIYARGGRAVIEAVTSSPLALEGGRATFTLKNEALALDTPIPSPSGWRAMGDLAPGDVIFGSDGSPVVVRDAKPVQHGRRCFRVGFSDGTSIVASDGHLWYAQKYYNTKPGVFTTGEMFEQFGRSARWRIPNPGVRTLPKADLPVDPYLVGLWLGDGSTGDCNIASGRQDVEEIAQILEGRGVETHVLDYGQNAVRLSFANQSGFGASMGTDVAKRFRGLECFRDKHIPASYMRASEDQRADLLRGLMDSDGWCNDTGVCGFSGNRLLVSQTLELLRSLGQVVNEPRFVHDDRQREGGGYRIQFTPRGGLVPFLLKRKSDRVRNRAHTGWVRVRDITEVESVPVRCIEVDASDHLFQAGVGGHVTHNTQNWNSSNSGHEMDSVIAGNLAKGRDGAARALSICNAHVPGLDSVGERDWDAYQEIDQGRSRATGVLYDALEAPPSTDMSEEDSLRAGLLAARGDSEWLDVDRLMGEIWDPRTPPSEARRKYLNQIVASEDSWCRPHMWDQLADSGLSLEPGDIVALGFDGSKSDDHSALIATRVSDGAWFTLGVWDPVPHGGEAPRELIDAAVGSAFEMYDVVAFYSDLHPWESYVDKWADEFGKGLCVNASPRHPIAFDMRARTKEFNSLGAMRVWDEINEQVFSHDGDARVRTHVHNAHRRPDRWGGVGFGKEARESPRKIDALAAGVLSRMAFRAYVALPDKKKRRVRSGRASF